MTKSTEVAKIVKDGLQKNSTVLIPNITKEQVQITNSAMDFLKETMKSDTISSNEVYKTLQQNMDSNEMSDNYKELTQQILDSKAKIIDNPNATEEDKAQAAKDQMEVFKTITEMEKTRVEENANIRNETIKQDEKNKHHRAEIIKIGSALLIGTALGWTANYFKNKF